MTEHDCDCCKDEEQPEADPVAQVVDTLWLSMTGAVEDHLAQAESHPRMVTGVMALTRLMHPDDEDDSRVVGLHQLCIASVCLLNNTRREFWKNALDFFLTLEQDDDLIQKVEACRTMLEEIPSLSMRDGAIINDATGEEYQLGNVPGALQELLTKQRP